MRYIKVPSSRPGYCFGCIIYASSGLERRALPIKCGSCHPEDNNGIYVIWVAIKVKLNKYIKVL
jgi:hypothetical protein